MTHFDILNFYIFKELLLAIGEVELSKYKQNAFCVFHLNPIRIILINIFIILFYENNFQLPCWTELFVYKYHAVCL